jgi:predicted house-cleaning noncanonical NTP pyrophosphatase (MazG superfamily)
MTQQFLFSEDVPLLGWSDGWARRHIYGPKGAMLLVLPRPWTPPFVLVSASAISGVGDGWGLGSQGAGFFARIRGLASDAGELIVRSSVVGESIWDRGSYESVNCCIGVDHSEDVLRGAVGRVLASAPGRDMALVIQRYIKPRLHGEFGNLLRISKTRDHWELSATSGAIISHDRFNTQRDEAASPQKPLRIKRSLSRERQFGSIAAWLNNYLLRGRLERLNCEWIADHEALYLVQIDEEDEDHVGINPFQIRISPSPRPPAARGVFLAHAEGDALKQWDKLKVLDELWEPEATHKPTLFFVPMGDLVGPDDGDVRQRLIEDFRSLVAHGNIVVRTSVRAGQEKLPNLPRTEGVGPETAAEWCIAQRNSFANQGVQLGDLAFVTHRFVPARASAWARAEPGNPVVDINSLWGLPDALQYCPYDIWEVHVPTETATDYPEYKSNMLIALEEGKWEYVRVKNELARSLSVGQREALDIARRTLSIAQNMGKPCHVMWFVGCVDEEGTRFSIPWYWSEAHPTEPNQDRVRYEMVEVSDPASLQVFVNLQGSRLKQAIQFRPTNQDLMRDTKFIRSVGAAAKAAGVPVILQGSTLAHAYYQLRREDCTVVTPSEKARSRVRRNITFGKLVRDYIPARIAARREVETTLRLPGEVIKGFLIGKLIEEAMEVRQAGTPTEKAAELSDLYEVVRALASAEKIPLEHVITGADEKKRKAGGFDDGVVLLQTGIHGRGKTKRKTEQRSQVLARRVSDDTYEIPFSFFGFMENGLSRSLVFEGLQARLDVTLKTDRIVITITKNAEQLEFPLDLTVGLSD